VKNNSNEYVEITEDQIQHESIPMTKNMAQQTNLEKIRVHLAEQFSLPRDQIEMMLPSFLAALASHMQNLEKALEANNPLLLGKAGHTIKGAFLNLGLGECAKVALCIEEKGKRGDTSTDYRSLIEDLRLRINPLLG
jgi:HPt (histidine-containing phosphotransfer) domain-containing protein